jgi:Kef-type K+ transport system membrane component KefB
MTVQNIFLSEGDLGHMFLAILTLLFFAHLMGQLFSRMHLPRVVGEICGGIFLGPSGVGAISPEMYTFLFNAFPEEGKILSFFYWIGLVLLLLTAGFKIDKSSEFKDQKIVSNLIISATLLPIIGGIIYYHLYDFTPYQGIAGSQLSMGIIVCISIAVTSIPVISKIFIDLDIIHSRFAKVVLATSTIQDLILWVILGVAIKTSTDNASSISLTVLISLLFLAGSLFMGPYLANYITKLKGNLLLESSPIGYILGICLFMIVMANSLGINIAFGALMAGYIIRTLSDKTFQSARDSISSFSLSFFIPIYFAIVGLKINLVSHFDVNLFLTFLFISSFLEIGSVCLGLRALKMDWLTRFNFGMAMNARGGPGIIIASMAYEFSIINEAFFLILILVAIVTSMISGSWFKFVLNRGWPLYQV